jgi:hypothetical protein
VEKTKTISLSWTNAARAALATARGEVSGTGVEPVNRGKGWGYFGMMKLVGKSVAIGTMVAVGLAMSAGARADEADAKKSLKAMSDYLAKQPAISFGYDASLEFVTKDHQKIMLANSGVINVSRPDKVRMTRDGGFSSVEMIFDGKTLTMRHKDANVYAQADVPGTLDHLVDELRDKYHKPAPGADLLLSNVYDHLMDGVIDVKDLGSGVIGGKECDHFAFREQEIDWQIWIAQGDRPYPCRYVITSKQVDQAPQYTVQVRDWKTGSEVTADNFGFTNSTNARKIDATELGDVDDLPKQFAPGGVQ